MPEGHIHRSSSIADMLIVFGIGHSGTSILVNRGQTLVW